MNDAAVALTVRDNACLWQATGDSESIRQIRNDKSGSICDARLLVNPAVVSVVADDLDGNGLTASNRGALHVDVAGPCPTFG